MFFYTFMPKLFNMSLTASVAIVFVILLRLLLKKAPKVISYALWGVVLFRLLCPVSIGSSFSVYNLSMPQPRVWNNYQRHRICAEQHCSHRVSLCCAACSGHQ